MICSEFIPVLSLFQVDTDVWELATIALCCAVML